MVIKGATNRLSSRFTLIKYLLFLFTAISWLMGCCLIGVGLWIIIDRSYLRHLVANDLLHVAAFVCLIGGGITFFIALAGLIGTLFENRCMILGYLICLIIIAILFFIGGLLAGIFRTKISNKVKSVMEDTLKNRYGVDLHIELNRDITRAWDKAQERLRCCSVSTESWKIYADSQWFQEFGRKLITQKEFTHEGQNPYVPSSCCVRDEYYRVVNEEVCMTWNVGPPGQQTGALNRALYYNGCYDMGKEFIVEHSGILIGLSISFCIFYFAGIFLSICMIILLRKQEGDL